jgi:hypothetical protein
MANGYSFRKLNDLIIMTKKMEHNFLHAPDHFTPEESIRYAQVLGLGGKKNLADAIVATRLGKHFGHEEFWRTVIQFFINIKDLNIDQSLNGQNRESMIINTLKKRIILLVRIGSGALRNSLQVLNLNLRAK